MNKIKLFEDFIKSSYVTKLDEMAIKRDIFSEFDEIDPFDSEHIKVMKDGKYNIVDNEGNLLSDVWFDSVEKKTDGDGFDVEFKDKSGETHSGSFLDLPEIKKNVEIRNLVKHTDMLDNIDFKDIILVDPYILKRPEFKRGIKIIANVIYQGENLLLGIDGKLYDKDGEIYDGIQFAISKSDIKRLCDKVNEISNFMLEKYHQSIYTFGYNTNKTDVQYRFSSLRQPYIHTSEEASWGKRSINSIKVRTNSSNIVKDILINKFNYEEHEVIDVKDYKFLTKEYLPTELDELFIELDEIFKELKKASGKKTKK